MRIIHSSDWHIGKSLNDYSLILDQKFYFDKFIDDLTELKPDALIVSGDVYDRSIPSSEAVLLLDSILNRISIDLKIPTFIITGNHDSKDRMSFAAQFLQKNSVYVESNIAKVIRKISLNNANFYLMPYFELHNIKQIYNNVQNINDAVKQYCQSMLDEMDLSKINVLIGHGFFVYSSSALQQEIAGSESVDASIFDNFDYVALGHIHSHKSIGSQKMQYCGSPLKYSIDEANHVKSYNIIDINDVKEICISTKTILPLHDLRVLNGDFAELIASNSSENCDDYVFVKLTDKNYILGGMYKLKTIFPNILGLSYENIKTDVSLKTSPDLSSKSGKIDEIKLFCEFFEQANSFGLDAEQLTIVENIFNEIKKDLCV